ncbi:IS5 family transposase [Pseudoroseomonas wenyumeiae]
MPCSSDTFLAPVELPQGVHQFEGRSPRVDERRVISGILHVLKTSCRWRDVPAAHSPPTTIDHRFNRWSGGRLWQRRFARMAASGNVPRELSLDNSHVKVHRSAAGGRRSRGGRTAKIHCLADDHGRPVACALTTGNVADISMALPRLRAVTAPKRLMAD